MNTETASQIAEKEQSRDTTSQFNAASPTDTPVEDRPPQTKRMPRKIFAAILFIILLTGIGIYSLSNRTSPPSATTANTPKLYHVGILSALDFFAPTTEGFKQRMTQLGYIEGKNIVYDIRRADRPVGNQSIIKDFVDAKVDLILAFPTEAAIEAKAGTKGTSIPVVSGNTIIEGSSLVDSLQRPGGNITGVRFPAPEIALKRLELMQQIAPKAKRLMVPYLKDYPSISAAFAAIEPAAAAAGIKLIKVPLNTTDPTDLKAYLSSLPAKGNVGFDGILFIPEPVAALPSTVGILCDYAAVHLLPVGGGALTSTDRGAIFTIGPNSFEVGKLAAPLAVKIFTGTKAGDIPIVSPENELKFNIKAAQRLGLTIDESLLSTATSIVR